MGTDTETSDSVDRREQRRRRRTSERADTRPSVAAPMAFVGIALVMFIGVLGVWAFRTVKESGPTTQGCRITERGVAVRRANGVGEPEQLAGGRVGDTYRSTSGCVPGDDGSPSD